MIPTHALAVAVMLGAAIPSTTAQDARGGRATQREAERQDDTKPRARRGQDGGERREADARRGGTLGVGARRPLTDDGDVAVTRRGDVLVSLGELEGRIVAVDEQEVTLEMLGRAGSRATVPLDNVPRAALFEHFERAIDPDDADSTRALADRAGRYGLHFHQADVLARLAELRPERADAIEQERRAAIEAGARSRLERARELRAAGEYARALRAFRDAAACEHAPAAREARAVLERIEADDTARDEARAERERRRADTGDEELDELFALQDEAEQALTQARREFGELEDATETLEGAEETLDEALARLDELAGDQPSDVHSGLRTSLEDLLVDVHVEAGYVYASLGDEQSARRHAGHASALDPNSPTVRQLRAAIASRDAFGSVLGGVGGGRR